MSEVAPSLSGMTGWFRELEATAGRPHHGWRAAALIDDPRGPSGDHGRSRRDLAVDILFVVAAVAWWVSVITGQSPVPSGQPSPSLRLFDFGFGLISCLLLGWRRRWPLGVAAFALLVGSFSMSSAIAGVLAIFTVAVHCSVRVTITVGAASIASLPFLYLLYPQPKVPLWSSFLTAALFTIAVLTWGAFVRQRRELVASLRERAERAEAEQQARVDQARRNERARIAREMHDVLAHRISLVSLHAGGLEFRPDAPAEEVQLAAGVIRESAHQALQELREVIGLLREGDPAMGHAPPERPQPTLTDIPQLVHEATAAGERVRYRCAVTDPGAVPEGIGRTAFRIVQESLTNARKHAPCAEVSLLLDGRRGEGLRIKVVNRLPPAGRPAPAPGAGLGLIGLSERVALAGGRLEHGVRPDGSFALQAWLPWPS